MKTNVKLITSVTVLVTCFTLMAQEKITLTPSELIPHEEGYYSTGIQIDENQDGIMEYHNGCDDYYEDDLSDGIYDPHVNHEETGEQQGFKYVNCMIMPDCEPKGSPIEPPVATGYIQMCACQFSNTDSAIYSYIQSPAISNLVSIYMETSADVSTNDSRKIPYNIEYSKDLGTTWEPAYLRDNVFAQGGYRITYDSSKSSAVKKMVEASKSGPIVLRIITNDRAVDPPYQGQFVNLHALTITAERASSLNNISQNELKIKIQNQTIISENGTIKVYTIMGQFVGTGNQIQVGHQGIYLVKPEFGPVQKILVK